MNTINTISNFLKKEGLRMTRPRLAVIKVLEKNGDRFASAEEIFYNIHRTGTLSCDQASVYRILNTFARLNIVIKSNFHGKASKFQLNQKISEKTDHRHFFRCQKCESITPLSFCMLAGQISKMESLGYKNLHHHVEISGTCPPCAD